MTAYITANNNSGKALIDKDVKDELNEYKWHVKKDGYMYRNASTEELRNGMPRSISMHRQLMGFPKGKTIDHINHDKLDNRLSNLRIASYSDNQANRRKLKRTSSKYKGVRYHRRDNVWHAYIAVEGEQKHLGTFEGERDAAQAYNSVAKKIFGDFALLNNIEECD